MANEKRMHKIQRAHGFTAQQKYINIIYEKWQTGENNDNRKIEAYDVLVQFISDSSLL